MNIYFILAIYIGFIETALTEDLRLVDLPPEEAQQYIESKDQSLKYAPKIESNVPAVRVLTDTPTNVLEDIYLANQYHGQDGLGGYLYGYSVPDIAKTEKKKAGGDLKGSYQYINDGGQEIKVQYWDDGTGFHQVDNLADVLPKQVEDAPDVQAAKDEFFKRWHEEAERNSKPVSADIQSTQQYQKGQYNNILPGQQYHSSQTTHQISSAQQNPNSYQFSGSHPGQSTQHIGQNLQEHVQSAQNQGHPGHNVYQLSEQQSSYGLHQTGQGQQQSNVYQTDQQNQNNPDQNKFGQSHYQSIQYQGAPSTYVTSQVQGGSSPHYGQGQQNYNNPDQNKFGQSYYQSTQYQGTPSTSVTSQVQGGVSPHYGQGQGPLSIHESSQSQSQHQPSQIQGQSQNQGIQSSYGAGPSQSSLNIHEPNQSQGQYQSSQIQGLYGNQPGSYENQFGQSPTQSSVGTYLPSQNSGSQVAQTGQYQPEKTQLGSAGGSNPGQQQSNEGTGQGYGHYGGGDYSGQSTNQYANTEHQSNNEWEYKERAEEKGPPKGFFYNFDYPVGIIVQKQGAAGGVHKRDSLEQLFTQNKATFDQQLKNGAGVGGSSQSSYQVHL